MGKPATILSFLLLLGTHEACSAPIPETGLWRDPRGEGPLVYLEASGDTLIAVLASLRPDGSARWWLASGSYGAHGLRAPLLEAERGSCYGCSPTPIVLRETGSELSVEMVTSVRGFLRIGGSEVREIERVDVGGVYREPRVFAGRGLAPALLPEPAGSWLVFGLEWRGAFFPRWFSDVVDFADASILGDPPLGIDALGQGRHDRAWWPLVLPDPDPPRHYRYQLTCRDQPGGATCTLLRESEETPPTTVFRDVSPLRFGSVITDLSGIALPPGFAMLRMPTRLEAPESGVWLDPERPGTGWLIDRVGENIAVLEVGFDADGRPSWWLAAAKLSADGTLRAERRRPFASSTGGELELAFTSLRTGRFEPGGVNRPLQRFAFGSGYSDQLLSQDQQLYHLPELTGRYALVPLRESAEGTLALADWPRLLRLGPGRRAGAISIWPMAWEDGLNGPRAAGALRCSATGCELEYESSAPWGTYVGAQPPTVMVRASFAPADLGKSQLFSRASRIMLLRLPEP